MTILRPLFLIFFLLLLSACGGKTTGPASVSLPSGERSDSVLTDQSVKQLLNKAELTCDTNEECPEGLGLLVGVENGKSYRCSAFVLENGLIYTNAHCIPEDLQGRSNVGCDQSIGFIFNVNGKAQQISCQKIVFSSDLSEGPGVQDVAAIKANLPKNLKRFKSTMRSRYSGERVAVWRVNPKDNWSGSIVKSTCSLKSNTFFGEFFDGPQSPALNTLGCETVAGNSGSPVVDKDGLVLGIHQSSLKDKSSLGESLLDHFKGKAFASLGTATNLSCLCKKHGIDQACQKLPKSCVDLEFSSSDRRRSKLVEQEIYKRSGNVAAAILSREGLQLPGYIKWEVAYGHRLNNEAASTGLTMNLMVAPHCLESETPFKREIKKSESEFRKTTHVLKMMAPFCKVDFLFNGLFDFEKAKIDESSCVNANMSLFLRFKNGAWEGEAQFIDEDIEAGDRPYAYNFKLPACKDI